VAFASRSLNNTAQREKEALAVTWACEKLSEYELGKQFEIEADHKPLMPLLGNKSLHSLPPCVLRFRFRLTRFQYTIRHVPGKEFYTPDMLSQAPLPNLSDKSNSISTDDIELFVQTVVNQLPPNKDRLNVYRQAKASDHICSKLIEYCKSGWPCQ